MTESAGLNCPRGRKLLQTEQDDFGDSLDRAVSGIYVSGKCIYSASLVRFESTPVAFVSRVSLLSHRWARPMTYRPKHRAE